jgi:hypothetical protein
MGKKVIAACGDEENLEKSYDDMMTASFVKPNKETGKLEPVHVFKEEGVDSLRDKRQGSEVKKPDPEYKNPFGLKGIGPGIQELIKKA